MNKKPIYKRPWFTPLLITIIIIAVATILSLFFGYHNNKFDFYSFLIGAFMTGIFAIPFIALVWIIFGLFMLWYKIHTKNKGLKKTKKDCIIPIPITQILASLTLVICFTIMNIFRITNLDVALLEIIPLSIPAIILHINSIKHFNKKIANKEDLSKSEININTANYICIALLIITVISSFLSYNY